MTGRPPTLVRTRVGGATAACAALLLALAWYVSSRPPAPARDDGRPALRALAQAIGSTRFIEGRLTGGFAPGSFQPATRSASARRPTWSPDVRIALADLERRYQTDDRLENEAAWATARLAVGDLDGGIASFDSLLARADGRADVWSDGAAAYLAGSAELGRHELWVQALEAAERARWLRPDLPEARFNRALALEGLYLFDQARQAWRDYLAVDSQSPWADEARSRERALARRVALPEAWAAFRTGLDGRLPDVLASDQGTVVQFRQDLRTWIEQALIPAWASAYLAGDQTGARDALDRAGAAADLLQRAGGDPLASSTLARARALVDRDPARARQLAAAHAAFPRIVRLSDDGAYGAAAAEFERVSPMFRAAGSPYAAFAALYDSVALYMTQRPDEARARLSSLEGHGVGSSLLAGMRDWMQGLIDLHQNRPDQARARYRDALRQFEALGESDSIGRTCALLSEAYAALGDPRQAWMYQRLALAQVPSIQVPRRKHLILQLAGVLSLRVQLPRAALAFQDAVIGAARAADRVPSLVEGHLHRARTYARTDRIAEAKADLDLARSLLPRIDAEPVRRSYGAEVNIATAEIHATHSPDLAVRAASDALDHFEAHSEYRRAGLYVHRGRALLALHQASLAEADFRAAIERFEALRSHVLDRQDRVGLFRDGMSAYAEMMRLNVPGDPVAALDFAERARARTLLDAVMGPMAKTEPAAGLPAVLPQGTTVLFYAAQPDRLWLWAVTRRGIQFFERIVPAQDLQFRIGRATRMLAGSGRGSSDSAARRLTQTLEALFTDLIGPARSAIADGGSLVVVPDGPLHDLSFAALLDPSTGKYLVQTNVISVAPSLTTFRRALAAPLPARRSRAVVFGDPAIVEAETTLGRLPFARDEARTVGRIYAGARVLLDAAATPAAFLTQVRHAEVVHYAGHAVVDPQEPGRSHLLLAPDPAHPMGTLSVDELRPGMLARHPLVVLAACSTNRGRIEIGEGVLSLARPFLAAGASDVIATLWDVDDRGSAELFRRFHHRTAAGVPAARALAEAQRDLLAAPDAAVRGPAGWAWAVAIGGGR